MSTATARCGGPSFRPHHPTSHHLDLNSAGWSEGSSHRLSPPTPRILLSPSVERGVRRCCCPSPCLVSPCIGTMFAAARLCWRVWAVWVRLRIQSPLQRKERLLVVSKGLRPVATSPWSLLGGPMTSRHFISHAFYWGPPAVPPSSWAPGRGLCVRDGAKPLLSGRQSRSLLPLSPPHICRTFLPLPSQRSLPSKASMPSPAPASARAACRSGQDGQGFGCCFFQ